MLIAVWIVNSLLALAFLFAGGTKLLRPKDSLRSMPGMTWVEDFSGSVVKLIGGAEVLGALGLILPLATGIVPILSPVAAIGLLIVMVGAVATHVRRKEAFTPPLALGIFAIASAVLGFLVLGG